MPEKMLNVWEAEAARMRKRDLTQDEKKAIAEMMLEGALKPDMEKRFRKNVLRSAIDGVRPGRKTRAAA